MLRGMLCLFMAGLIVSVMALCVGIVGCYRRSSKLVGWTAMLFLLSGPSHLLPPFPSSLKLFFSVLFHIFGMLIWHYVNYMDRKVLDVYPFYLDWPKVNNNYAHDFLFLQNASGIFILFYSFNFEGT
jgi:hypothetical protein